MTYNRETIIEKNATLSFEFERYMLEHPAILERIPNGAEVVLLPKDDPELYRLNLEAAQTADKVGPVVYVEIAALAPARSRLVKPRLTTRSALRPVAT
ncbi:MAG: hypothetical protein CVV17_03490 [Gammaproteobacteria bacterium HGW-Gammaproteobacteria-7]|nr:MAG: hypothetical protein CVV17_03490 [Gammaproteobacteria bacterium HGW-Gammaproteobacteria-7]PKO21034.1 MAG: hypothetical protein CVU38_16925 [Chloroflexi bacterium HGW-Chloroflexi-1]